MNDPSPSRSKRSLGITGRIAMLSWAVTLVTLVIFVVVIIPEQERTYLGNLESKARGISASLTDVTAGAVVTEDYSSVVDHCKQVLQGDPSIEFLVVTKNDGFSLVHLSGGKPAPGGQGRPPEARWHTDTLNDYWHPFQRDVQSGINVVPLFNQRVFHYARPFDYSGIEWGWIHVGLSLESYDKSVRAVYWRTGLLAVFCLLFSLGASVLYAKRLVRPLHALTQVVSQVSAGDLAARADIRSKDEIQDLAQSFNSMTDALLDRDRILESVRLAAQQFLSNPDWRQVIDGVLAKIGQAAGVSRVYVFENHAAPDGTLLCSQRFEWAAPGVDPQIGNPLLQAVAWEEAGIGGIARKMERGEMVVGLARDMGPAERALTEPQGILSLAMVPITVDGAWWGFLGLDECKDERRWTVAELDSLRTATDMLGAAIARHRAESALLEAKATLEERVEERTRELQEQVAATRKAHEDLAEAQHRLMATSRMAGMAEVATGVLHNVGNVLNSVNVSASLVFEHLRQSKAAKLGKAAALLHSRAGDLTPYLTRDPVGRKLPGYLARLGEFLVAENARLLAEVGQLASNIEHIKEVVAMQQGHAKISGVYEILPIEQVVEDSLAMNASSLKRHGIEVERCFADAPPVCADRHKVLQILINLIRNARYALDEVPHAGKRITLTIAPVEKGGVRVGVADNGVGISPENLTRIFAHGFTTRRDGHGFGLHAGALAAKEMGGALTVASPGVGQGATFTLELPAASVPLPPPVL